MLNKKLIAVSLGLIVSVFSVAPAFAEEAVTPQPAYAQSTDIKSTPATQATESSSTSQSTDLTSTQTSQPTDSVVKPALADADPATKSGTKGDNHLLSRFPHRLAVFTAGFFVGTPCAVIHQSEKESVSGVTDLIGTNRNPFVLLPAIAISIPFGIASGIFGGPTTTAYNSVKHCGDDPITKQTLGIGSSSSPGTSK